MIKNHVILSGTRKGIWGGVEKVKVSGGLIPARRDTLPIRRDEHRQASLDGSTGDRRRGFSTGPRTPLIHPVRSSLPAIAAYTL